MGSSAFPFVIQVTVCHSALARVHGLSARHPDRLLALDVSSDGALVLERKRHHDGYMIITRVRDISSLVLHVGLSSTVMQFLHLLVTHTEMAALKKYVYTFQLRPLAMHRLDKVLLPSSLGIPCLVPAVGVIYREVVVECELLF